MEINDTTAIVVVRDEVFTTEEHPELKPLPEGAFDIPTWANPSSPWPILPPSRIAHLDIPRKSRGRQKPSRIGNDLQTSRREHRPASAGTLRDQDRGRQGIEIHGLGRGH